MTMKRVAAVVMGTVIVSGLSGCAMFNEGTLQYSRTTTVGKELVDLQEAKAKGAISEEEYVKVKNDILEGAPFKVEKLCSETK